MLWGKLALRALLCGVLSAPVGCCYHAQHFGKKRDIGWGEIGCETCLSDCQSHGHSGGHKGKVCDASVSPTATADANGNTVLSVAYREPTKSSSFGRLRERIDARKTDRIEIVVPQDVLLNQLAASAPTTVLTTNAVTTHTVTPTSAVTPTMVVTPTTVVTPTPPPTTPASIVAAETPPLPLPPLQPVDVPIRNVDKK